MLNAVFLKKGKRLILIAIVIVLGIFIFNGKIPVWVKNGNPIVLDYFCSDICPAYGHFNLIYKDIDANKCKDVGGYMIYDPAWGGFEGCSPKYNSPETDRTTPCIPTENEPC